VAKALLEGASFWKNFEIWTSFQDSGEKIRVFEQNTDINKFCFFVK